MRIQRRAERKSDCVRLRRFVLIVGKMSSYLSTLSADTRSRYIDKLVCLGFNTEDDPYILFERSKASAKYIETCGWRDDVSVWPSVEFGSIYTYLIKTPGPFTMDNMNAYKSLDAYNFFISGWVQTCYFKKSDTGFSIIAGKVNRSQAVTDTPHQAWAGIHQKDGTIQCGHCTCMAGLGEVCSHVAALLFKVECNTRLGHNQQSCTSLPCQWNQTFMKKIEPALVAEINFSKPKRLKTKREPLYAPRAQEADNIMDPSALLNDLKDSAPNAVIFTIVNPKKSEVVGTKYPKVVVGV